MPAVRKSTEEQTAFRMSTIAVQPPAPTTPGMSATRKLFAIP